MMKVLDVSDSMLPDQPIFKLDQLEIPMKEVDTAVEHCVLYVDAKQKNKPYLKCKNCGMPGHEADDCRPLIMHSLCAAFADKHPEIIAKIKKVHTMVPRRMKSPGKFHNKKKLSINQIMQELDLSKACRNTR